MDLRISATQLESFRLLISEDWMTEERYLNQLTTSFQANPAMNFGTAYHRLLEKGLEFDKELNTLQTISEKDLLELPERYKNTKRILYKNIPDSVIKPALDFRLQHPLITNEVKLTKEYSILGNNITLVVKADGLEGLIINEHKTTNNPDFEKYNSSYQWRYYLQVFGGELVIYNVFELLGSSKNMREATNDQSFAKCVTGVELYQFKMMPYSNLKSDCIELLTQFVAYISSKQLHTYFAPVVDNVNLIH